MMIMIIIMMMTVIMINDDQLSHPVCVVRGRITRSLTLFSACAPGDARSPRLLSAPQNAGSHSSESYASRRRLDCERSDTSPRTKDTEGAVTDTSEIYYEDALTQGKTSRRKHEK
jgi:hypothetical protein